MPSIVSPAVHKIPTSSLLEMALISLTPRFDHGKLRIQNTYEEHLNTNRPVTNKDMQLKH